VPAVSHVLGDARATPPDTSPVEFQERLVLLPRSFFANDYAASHGLVRHVRRAALPGAPAGWTVLASFSSWSKLTPHMASAWAQVLRAVPRTLLWVLAHKGHGDAWPRFRREMLARGVPPGRVLLTPLAPWLDHVRRKTAADVVLDTDLKNGHTSVADALWAGAPVLSVPGQRMQARVALSLLAAAEPALALLAAPHSKREYTLLARRLAESPRARLALRAHLQAALAAPLAGRRAPPLFDTPRFAADFVRAIRALLDAPQTANLAIIER
jgi:predicted O-linked N-acetylglucosamine transferase (SPINDLY family)